MPKSSLIIQTWFLVWMKRSGWPRFQITKPGTPIGQQRSRAMTCATMTAMLRQEPSLYLSRLTQQIEKSAASPWGVQVGAGFSRERALASYSDIEKRHRESLAGLDPIIMQTTLRSRGTQPFYQVRIGADTRVAADRLCASLRKGGTPCMVLRNRA